MNGIKFATARAVAAVVIGVGMGMGVAPPFARAAVPHEGHGDEKPAEKGDALAALSRRMQELASAIERELDVEKSVAAAREKWDLDDEKANDLATLLANARDRHAAHGDESRSDRAALADHARALAGDECAKWVHEKFAKVDGIAEEMRALGSEIAAAALARRDEAMAHGEEAHRLAEHVRKEVEESYRDAIARFREAGSEDWKELVARSVDKDAIERLRRDAMAMAEAERAEHVKAAELFREKLGSQQGDLAARHRELAEAALKLAQERRAAAGADHDSMRRLLESHAKRAEELAVERAREAEAAARAMEERHRAHAGAAKERARKMDRGEREKAISKRRGEKSELDAARAEIEALQLEIETLQRRVRALQEASRMRHADQGGSRDV